MLKSFFSNIKYIIVLLSLAHKQSSAFGKFSLLGSLSFVIRHLILTLFGLKEEDIFVFNFNNISSVVELLDYAGITLSRVVFIVNQYPFTVNPGDANQILLTDVTSISKFSATHTHIYSPYQRYNVYFV
jgi:hypothetical protein